MTKQVLLIAILSLILAGCTTVNIVPDGQSVSESAPTWQQRQHFFLFGLVGESHIDVRSICSDREVAQMQSQQTFLDGVFGLLTASIYAPRTAKVWCE